MFWGGEKPPFSGKNCDCCFETFPYNTEAVSEREIVFKHEGDAISICYKNCWVMEQIKYLASCILNVESWMLNLDATWNTDHIILKKRGKSKYQEANTKHQKANTKNQIPKTKHQLARWCMTRRKCLVSPLCSPKRCWSATSPPSGSPSPCQEGRCSGELFPPHRAIKKDNFDSTMFSSKRWDGLSRAHVDLPRNFHDSVAGLCGTFTADQVFPENYHVKVVAMMVERSCQN